MRIPTEKNTDPHMKSFAAPTAGFAPSFIGSSLSSLSRTKANGRLGLFCDVAISFTLISLATSDHVLTPVTMVGCMLIGLGLFTFIEYGCHRWLFHGGAQALERGHWQHHLFPLGDDSLPFFIPPAILAFSAFLLAAFIQTGVALSLVGGLAAGYSIYGLSHIVIHRKQFRHAGLRRWAAAHHIHHHHPDKNFGVTSALWDVILGTRYVPTRQHTRRQD